MNITKNTVKVGDKALKVVRFREPLYRANKGKLTKFSANGSFALPNYLASEEYAEAPFKYFTLNKNELKAYTKYGMPYMKTWRPLEDLVLIDILDVETRGALAEIIGADSLNIAFPWQGNKVSRISEENTKHHDDNVLKALCALGLDGYYMRRLTNNNGQYVFHSEVGLCKNKFSKLRVDDIKKVQEAPPVRARPTRSRFNTNNTPRRTRFRNNSNKNSNNSNNNYKKLNVTRKTSRMTLLNLF